MSGCVRSGSSKRVTKCGRKLRTSASIHTTMSPSVTYSDSQRALPLPLPGGIDGSTSCTRWTVAPSSSAASAVLSVDPSSMTTISSTRCVRSTRRRRTLPTIWPTVPSSSRAGRTTETDVPSRTLCWVSARASGLERGGVRGAMVQED
jgi:hypothetical protein